MRQVIRRGIREIIVDEVPDPAPPPHHVVVRPAYSLISAGTETASIHQEALLKEVAENPSHIRKVLDVARRSGPVATWREVQAKLRHEYAVLGYSGAGVVVARHPSVVDLSVGQAVAYGGEGTGHAELIVTGRRLVAPVPDGTPLDQAAFTTLGSIAMNAVRVAGIAVGDVVAVIGLGLIGQLVAQLARCQGGRVVGIDLREDRVDLARRLGAEASVTGEGARAAVLALAGGRGADHVIIAAAAKSAAPCQLAAELVRDRGRIVVVGAVEMAFPWMAMYAKEVELRMARAYGPGSYDPSYEREAHDYPVSYVRWTENRNMEEFLRLIAAGQLRLRELVTHEVPFEEARRAYATVMDPSTETLGVLLRYPTPDPSQVPSRRKVRLLAAAAPRRGEVRVGLAGAGNLAKWAHLPVLTKLDGVRLCAVHSTAGYRGKGYAARFGAEYATSSFDELVADPDLDAIVLVTRNAQHATQAAAALRAGKHVFVEKPLALSREECRVVADAARDSGRVVGVGFNRRFAPVYSAMRGRLARRASPAVVTCRVNSPGIAGGYWMADPAIGGAILGEACHFVDLLYWLLGSEPVAVSAWSLPVHDGEPIGQNNVAANLLFADGSVANLTYCTVGHESAGGERVEAFSPGITVRAEDFRRFEVAGRRLPRRRRLFADKGYHDQMRDFVAAIREGREPSAGLEAGVRATVGCLGILEAAERGSSVALEWVGLLDGTTS